jgi:hypothetical protein
MVNNARGILGKPTRECEGRGVYVIKLEFQDRADKQTRILWSEKNWMLTGVYKRETHLQKEKSQSPCGLELRQCARIWPSSSAPSLSSSVSHHPNNQHKRRKNEFHQHSNRSLKLVCTVQQDGCAGSMSSEAQIGSRHKKEQGGPQKGTTLLRQWGGWRLGSTVRNPYPDYKLPFNS